MEKHQYLETARSQTRPSSITQGRIPRDVSRESALAKTTRSNDSERDGERMEGRQKTGAGSKQDAQTCKDPRPQEKRGCVCFQEFWNTVTSVTPDAQRGDASKDAT